MSTLTPEEGTPSPSWVKSSFSFANGNCVEVADLPGGHVGVRDSKDPQGQVLRFTPGEWHAFVGGVRSGEFDRFGRLSSLRTDVSGRLARGEGLPGLRPSHGGLSLGSVHNSGGRSATPVMAHSRGRRRVIIRRRVESLAGSRAGDVWPRHRRRRSVTILRRV